MHITVLMKYIQVKAFEEDFFYTEEGAPVKGTTYARQFEVTTMRTLLDSSTISAKTFGSNDPPPWSVPEVL